MIGRVLSLQVEGPTSLGSAHLAQLFISQTEIVMGYTSNNKVFSLTVSLKGKSTVAEIKLPVALASFKPQIIHFVDKTTVLLVQNEAPFTIRFMSLDVNAKTLTAISDTTANTELVFITKGTPIEYMYYTDNLYVLEIDVVTTFTMSKTQITALGGDDSEGAVYMNDYWVSFSSPTEAGNEISKKFIRIFKSVNTAHGTLQYGADLLGTKIAKTGSVGAKSKNFIISFYSISSDNYNFNNYETADQDTITQKGVSPNFQVIYQAIGIIQSDYYAVALVIGGTPTFVLLLDNDNLEQKKIIEAPGLVATSVVNAITTRIFLYNSLTNLFIYNTPANLRVIGQDFNCFEQDGNDSNTGSCKTCNAILLENSCLSCNSGYKLSTDLASRKCLVLSSDNTGLIPEPINSYDSQKRLITALFTEELDPTFKISELEFVPYVEPSVSTDDSSTSTTTTKVRSLRRILARTDGVPTDNTNGYFKASKPFINGKSIQVKIDFSFMDADFNSEQQLKLIDEFKELNLLNKAKTKEFWDFPIIFPKVSYSLLGNNSSQKTKGNIISFMYRWSFRIIAPFFQIAGHNILKTGNFISMFKFFNIKQSSRINALNIRMRIDALGFLPKYYKIDEKKVGCTPKRKFDLHSYSCLIFNNISHLYLALFILIIIKFLIYIPLVMMKQGKVKQILIKINQFFGVMTFFYFISAFEVDFLIASIIDATHTIGDQNGQLFGKMTSIATMTLVGYSIIKLSTKSTDILYNKDTEAKWLYIKNDVRPNVFKVGFYIAEITAIRDFVSVVSIIYLYDRPILQALIPFIAVLICFIVRCVTFPKVNILENIVAILTEFLLAIILLQYVIQVQFDFFGFDFFADIIITEIVIVALVSIFGELLAIINQLILISLNFKSMIKLDPKQSYGNPQEPTNTQQVFQESFGAKDNDDQELMANRVPKMI